jgi:hypothetical protein
LRVFWKHAVPVIDPNTLPKDVDTLRKIVVDLCEQLSHESSEKDKYRSLLRDSWTQRPQKRAISRTTGCSGALGQRSG